MLMIMAQEAKLMSEEKVKPKHKTTTYTIDPCRERKELQPMQKIFPNHHIPFAVVSSYPFRVTKYVHSIPSIPAKVVSRCLFRVR